MCLSILHLQVINSKNKSISPMVTYMDWVLGRKKEESKASCESVDALVIYT